MKAVRISLIVLAAAVLAAGISTTSYAFHSGGVAECEGCHSMHSPAPGGERLLLGATRSETCLICHEHEGDTGPTRYHISTATADMTGTTPNPKQRTPGGDFAWLKRVWNYTASGTSYTETGGGHMVNAPANDYVPDNVTSPGGSFPGLQLECNSCHDPHGKFRRLASGTIATAGAPIRASGSYNDNTSEPVASGTSAGAVGVYRLLAGFGYTNGGVTFPGVPAAKVPSTYNQSEATNQVKVAYGVATTGGHANWGTWCATCHGAMHSDGNYVHPVDSSMSDLLSNYNTYVNSGNMGGSQPTSFLSLTPFAMNTGSYATLATNSGNASPTYAGPTDGDQVTCLSCHRAHASGFAHALRFDLGYEFVTKGSQYIGSDNPEITGSRAALQHRGRTNADWQAAYYDRPATPTFATYQRVLCNKCHAKD